MLPQDRLQLAVLVQAIVLLLSMFSFLQTLLRTGAFHLRQLLVLYLQGRHRAQSLSLFVRVKGVVVGHLIDVKHSYLALAGVAIVGGKTSNEFWAGDRAEGLPFDVEHKASFSLGFSALLELRLVLNNDRARDGEHWVQG